LNGTEVTFAFHCFRAYQLARQKQLSSAVSVGAFHQFPHNSGEWGVAFHQFLDNWAESEVVFHRFLLHSAEPKHYLVLPTMPAKMLKNSFARLSSHKSISKDGCLGGKSKRSVTKSQYISQHFSWA
jgi:hypothetical protein